MKKIVVLFILTVFLVLSCGGSEDPSDNTDVEETSGNGEIEEVTEAPSPLYPEGTLDPSAITAETPISAVALYNAYFAWKDKKVTLEGYPYVFYGDTFYIEDQMKLIAEPESDEKLAEITFSELANVTVRADEPITISGTVEYSWTGRLGIIDAVIVKDAAPAEQNYETSPYVYDGEVPILISEFFEMFNIWKGKEVTVDGYYHSSTTSTTSYGKTIRVDLADPEDTYTKYVACEMVEEIPEEIKDKMAENRAGTQIRGIIIEEKFDLVGLENCELINR